MEPVDDWKIITFLGAEAVLNFGPVQLVGEHENLWLNREAEWKVCCSFANRLKIMIIGWLSTKIPNRRERSRSDLTPNINNVHNNVTTSQRPPRR